MQKKDFLTELVYEGLVFKIEFYVASDGKIPARLWLENLPLKMQQKFAALFVRLADHGKIWNERKFKHLTETDQIFEFKVDSGRILSFFFFGKRVILTHGFSKKADKTPKNEIEKAESIKQDFEKRTRSQHEKKGKLINCDY